MKRHLILAFALLASSVALNAVNSLPDDDKSDNKNKTELNSVVKKTWEFYSTIKGNAPCTGHSECDAILAENGKVLAQPGLEANHVDAQLIHEAAIGKIAGEQLIKLMTLGLTEEEAENQIINGFLK